MATKMRKAAAAAGKNRLDELERSNGVVVPETEEEQDLLAALGAGRVVITPVDQAFIKLRVEGTAPYLQLKFSEKSKAKMRETHEAGEKAKGRKRKEPRDFDADYQNALHRFADGGYGIPAAAFKAAMVSAAKLCGLPMTRAKLLVHVVADGLDVESADPLVRIEGKPECHIGHVRNATGVVDLRARGIWRQWACEVNVSYDHSSIDPIDVYNLLYRAGVQVGVGEGRPDSKKSCGMGMGTFKVTNAPSTL